MTATIRAPNFTRNLRAYSSYTVDGRVQSECRPSKARGVHQSTHKVSIQCLKRPAGPGIVTGAAAPLCERTKCYVQLDQSDAVW